MLAKRAERISASQLAAYGHCQFKHFVTTHLKPETLELPVFDALQRGSVVHDWLWELGMTPGGWANPGPVLDRLFAVGPPDTPPSVFASGRSRAEWEHWATRVREWATEEAERIAARPFQPTYNELAFGRGDRDRVDPASRPDPITLEFDGRAIAFAGSIDRVDCWTDDRGTRWGLALDYKTGSVDEYTAKLSTGDELQLPLYLRVLEALGIKPAGALYLSIKDGGIAGIVRAEFAPRLGDLGQRVIVATEEEWAELRAIADRAVLAHHDGMRNGQLRVWPRDGKCEFCTLQALCRIDLWKARREEARG
jgi:ATP-dependent helicase/DNAse subunit B